MKTSSWRRSPHREERSNSSSSLPTSPLALSPASGQASSEVAAHHMPSGFRARCAPAHTVAHDASPAHATPRGQAQRHDNTDSDMLRHASGGHGRRRRAAAGKATSARRGGCRTPRADRRARAQASPDARP